jgi:hypothetical protein
MLYQQDGDPTQTVHHLNMPGRAAEVARCLDQSRPVGWRLRRWSRRLRVDRGSSTGVAESLGSVDMVRNSVMFGIDVRVRVGVGVGARLDGARLGLGVGSGLRVGLGCGLRVTAPNEVRGTAYAHHDQDAHEHPDGHVRGVCCVGGKQTSFPLCCLDQMARASSVKITVS